MRLFIYSDVHISRTSSILPITSSYRKYTYRQDMIVKTAQWMTDIIQQNNVDMIINLGDTFDQNTITSYDIDTASEFFKVFQYLNKQHIILCGNHEMLNTDYNVLKLLDNIQGIQVIDTPTVIDNLLFLPYCDYKDLDLSNYNGSDYAFMHHDIYGSKISANRILDFGIEKDSLSKFKKVFNGHVHACSKFANIVNVGSITTHSFADSTDSVPTCYIFDTVTQELKEFENKICPLFRKIKIDTIEEANDYIKEAENSTYNFILQVECDFEMKNDIEALLQNCNKILNYKIVTKSIKQEEQNQNSNITLESNLDIKQSFKDFLNSGVELRYPMNLYNVVIGEVKGQEEVNVNDITNYDTGEVINTWEAKCGIENKSQENMDKISNKSSNLF